MLERNHYLAGLEHDGTALATAARADLRAAVPSCPDWTVGELVEHTGEGHRFWTKVAAGATDPHDVPRESPPAPDLVVEWYEEGLHALLQVLRSVDPDRPIWTWARGDHTASWIIRRMAHETAVHRWDAQNAVGGARPIETQVAADGIDELLFVFLPADQQRHRGAGESVHVHCTDEQGEWFVRLTDRHFEVTREHAKGDVALRGPASDLLLALWERVPLETVEVLGDAVPARKLIAAIDRT